MVQIQNSNPINKHIQVFVLLSLLLAIVNIHYNTYLFHDGESEGELLSERSSPQMAVEAEGQENITTTTNISTTTRSDSFFDAECFRARNDTVPTSKYGKLKPPYVNLGFPKMGTTSLHSFFACAGYRAMHYRCNDQFATENGLTCAECIRKSVKEGLPPFARCGTADAYSQLDNGSWGSFPQVEYLEEIVGGLPNGTFLLTFRGMREWYHSITHWPPDNESGPHMSDGLRDADITGFPSGTGNDAEEFGRWFCGHVRRVRDVVAEDPSRTLVEIDIEDPDAGRRMSEAFDVDESCWGRRNVNAKLHPERDASRSEPDLPWLVRGKACVRGKTKMRLRRTEPLPPVPGVPPWLLMVNDTCDDA